MVLPDSCKIPRVPHYLGTHTMECTPYVYRGITCSAGPSQNPSTSLHISYSLTSQQPGLNGPTTPSMQRLSAITHIRFGLFRVRSPLLTESQLFSLPVGTEMFHFPTFPPTALCVQAEVAGHDSGISRFPYSEIHGSKLVYQLPMAYRRLQRPSSALGAKASTDRT